MKKILITMAAAALAAASFGTDLWNQEAPFHTTGGGGVIDQNFASPYGAYATFNVDDVLVTGGTWNVTSIQTEIIMSLPADFANITQATLNVFSGGSSLPSAGSNPSLGTTVNVSVTADPNFTNAFYVTASGLNLTWTPGEYWVGLTAIVNYATTGETYIGYTNPAVNNAGANYTSALENPGGGFGKGTGWLQYSAFGTTTSPIPNSYGAMDIQGTATPEPASMAVLGLGIVGIIARRRRSSK
jgi:hypothetical protein